MLGSGAGWGASTVIFCWAVLTSVTTTKPAMLLIMASVGSVAKLTASRWFRRSRCVGCTCTNLGEEIAIKSHIKMDT